MYNFSDKMERTKNFLANKVYGHIKVSIYIYVLLKYIFKKTNEENRWLLKALTIFLLSPLVFCTLIFLKLLRWTVTQIIAASEGTRFYRLLDGTESIFCVDEESDLRRPIICNLFYIDFDGTPEEFRLFSIAQIRRAIQKRKFVKFTCTREYSLGYFYFKKFFSRYQEFFRVLEVPDGTTNENVCEAIGNLLSLPLPHQDKALWDVHIGDKQVEGRYLLMMRVHHSFGDGATLFNMFTSEFQGKDSNETDSDKYQRNIYSLRKQYVDNPFITMNGLIDSPDCNIFTRQSGSKHAFWHTEKEKPSNLMSTIKEVKKHFPKSTFTSIILTALTETLDNYMKKENLERPNNIISMVPLLLDTELAKDYGKNSDYKVCNDITLGFLRLPLKLANESASKEKNLRKRFELINKEYEMFKHLSVDNPCNRWQGRVLLSVLPYFVYKWLVKKYGPSLLVSNIPGCDSLNFFGRCKVTDFVVIDPNCSTAGLTLMVTSYENRLNFAYTIDKKTISDLKEVRKISEQLLDNIHLLAHLSQKSH